MQLTIKKEWFRDPKFKYISNGKKKAAVILDKETILYLLNINKKIPRQANPTFQDIAINIPNPVATALPPLPLSQTGQICPDIANNPAKTSK